MPFPCHTQTKPTARSDPRGGLGGPSALWRATGSPCGSRAGRGNPSALLLVQPWAPPRQQHAWPQKTGGSNVRHLHTVFTPVCNCVGWECETLR